jgi:hypothetical protein
VFSAAISLHYLSTPTERATNRAEALDEGLSPWRLSLFLERIVSAAAIENQVNEPRMC